MSITVRFNPTANSEQAVVIPNATRRNDGVMTKEQVAALAAAGGIVQVAFDVTLAMLQGAGAVTSVAIPIGAALPTGARFVGMIVGETDFEYVDDPTHDICRVTFMGLLSSSTQVGDQAIVDVSDNKPFPRTLGAAGNGPGGIMTDLGGQVPTVYVAMSTATLDTVTAGHFSVQLFYQVVA